MKRILVIAVLAFTTCMLTGCGSAIPNVKGMSAEQAASAIHSSGFKTGHLGYDEKSTAATGTVIAQAPEAGRRAKSGSVVAVTVAGPPPVPAPVLVGLDRAAAKAALAGIGLTLGKVTESYNATVPAGAIATQSPPPGTAANKGTSIGIVISKGPEPVVLPSVTKKMQAEAKRLLEAAGFKVAVVTKADKSAKGTVLAINPPGDSAVPGTKIVITVSTGVEMVRVPNAEDFHSTYTGDDWGKSLDSLQAAVIAGFWQSGLVATVEYRPGAPGGDSISQSPKAGSMVPRGTKVKVDIPVYD